MKKVMKGVCKIVTPLVAASFAASCNQQAKKDIYIAWSNKQDSYSFISTIKTIEAIGCNPVILDMVKSNDVSYDNNDKLIDAVDEHGILLSKYAEKIKKNSWRNSNVSQIAKDIDCIIFPGGSDICPTLYKIEEAWHGIIDDTDYSAERDISDYILMSYCLEKDIPLFAICRGMQMLSVVSGAKMISDIPTYFANQGKDDKEVHRDKEKAIFASHEVEIIDKDSLIYKITNKDKLEKVPSWHHQGVLSIEDTSLSLSGVTTTDGINMIEAVERKDSSFCLGVQFHPEVAVRKYIDKEKDADNYMNYEDATSFFKALINNTK